jgi:hypothetical protein
MSIKPLYIYDLPDTVMVVGSLGKDTLAGLSLENFNIVIEKVNEIILVVNELDEKLKKLKITLE